MQILLAHHLLNAVPEKTEIAKPVAQGRVLVFSLKSFLFGDVYALIRAAVNYANTDDSVSAILLDMDTPGGFGAECAETAEIIRASKVPVIGYVAGSACSAGYWLAAACHKIVAHRSAYVGSIGSFVCIWGKMPGEVVVVSSLSPNKVPDPENIASIENVRKHCDEVTTMFVADIARYRGTDEANVLANWGQGDIINSENALQLGMVDAIGNFNDAMQLAANFKTPETGGQPLLARKTGAMIMKKFLAVKDLRFKTDAAGQPIAAAEDAAPVSPEQTAEITVDFIKENYPEIAEALKEEGRKEERDKGAEVDQAAELADTTDPKENEIVAMARSGKIKAHEVATKILTYRKESGKKPDLRSLLADNTLPKELTAALLDASKQKEPNHIREEIRKSRGL